MTGNEKICDEIKRIMYAGVGAVAVTVEAANEVFNKLSQKGYEYMNNRKEHASDRQTQSGNTEESPDGNPAEGF